MSRSRKAPHLSKSQLHRLRQLPHRPGFVLDGGMRDLPLKKRQRILYIFDYGDEWRHQVTLEAIEPDAAKPGQRYPAITER